MCSGGSRSVGVAGAAAWLALPLAWGLAVALATGALAVGEGSPLAVLALLFGGVC